MEIKKPFAMRGMKGLVFDSFGNATDSNQRNNHIQKFGSNGNYLSSWGLEGNQEGEFLQLHALVVVSK